MTSQKNNAERSITRTIVTAITPETAVAPSLVVKLIPSVNT
jgi:hypothetical protein